MLNNILLYAGSIIAIVWGIFHLVPTRSIVSGVDNISRDNKLIFTMEWIAEGLALVFLGVLVLTVNILHGYQDPAAQTVFRLSSVMLVVMAILTALTGGRTKVIFFKICPIVKTMVAAVVILAVYL